MQRIHCKTQTASAVQKQNKTIQSDDVVFFLSSLNLQHIHLLPYWLAPASHCSHPHLQTCLVRLYLKRDDGL